MMTKMNKVRAGFIVFGVIILIIVLTIGRANESLQPILTKVVQCYAISACLLSIINYLIVKNK